MESDFSTRGEIFLPRKSVGRHSLYTKAEFPFPGMARNTFQVFRVSFLREDRETGIGFAGCPSAEPPGLRDGGLLLGEHTLLDELTGFVQRVAASASPDWISIGNETSVATTKSWS